MKEQVLLTDNVILNGGDSAILAGTIKALADNLHIGMEQLVVHCDYYDSAVQRYPQLPLKRSLQEAIRNFPPRFFWRFSSTTRFTTLSPIALSQEEQQAYRDYRRADKIITCGGSFLTDSYNVTLTLLGYDVALNNGTPIYLLGQSLGPFHTEKVKKEVGNRLKRFNKVVVRDHQSYLTALEMGCDKSKVIEARDMAFCIETQAQPRKLKPAALTVGLSVRQWTYPTLDKPEKSAAHHRYLTAISGLIEHLINNQDNINIVLISTCQGDESYSFKDHQVAHDIRQMLPQPLQSAVTVNADFQTPESFLTHLQTIDVFIGTRMHGCIMALLQNIPTINICYEFKSRELFNDMDLVDYVMDIENIDVQSLINAFTQLLTNYEQVSQNIYDHVNRYRAINNQAVRALFD